MNVVTANPNVAVQTGEVECISVRKQQDIAHVVIQRHE